MNVNSLNNEFQGMDLSLLDQLLKGRFTPGSKVLDAGFGAGRNVYWFLNNGFEVFGIDSNEEAVVHVRERVREIGKAPKKFTLGDLANLEFEIELFELVICNAVLHFAQTPAHFYKMFAELVRVLKPKGILFIRMTSNIGLENRLGQGDNGVYFLPDGSHRFLLTREILASLLDRFDLKFVEDLKTVNVNDLRCMSTLVLTKSKISE